MTYTALTFDGRIPGPLLRVRQGDTVDITITSHEGNLIQHNIDLHAVRGPGGRAVSSLMRPVENSYACSISMCHSSDPTSVAS